ncbi:MAG: class III aminotransferase [Rhodobacteraceae bacterium]|uniref:aspartate aminotransferase family protein n=1 Tax=Cypionkella sp. TaxID=2811411 RepID=UPI00132621F3|nr:aspartate aminotransferase family protein [Cypionkella sp.]KAF0174034.1 MAG: class III aminotransferase [Paracoccaceae bacterium]MDO8326932.1 aspartate aminotransferase family protein [Cypionkella sp.]
MKNDGTMVNAYVPGKGNLSAEDQALVARRVRALGPAYRLFYETPVHLVRGEGVWLYDAEGNAYLDTYNNVASVGHCHPAVVAATARQAAVFASHTRYLHDTVLDYAERLLGHFPPELSHVMFTCTGSEANDLAFRIARAHTGGTGFIVTENAYHGVTYAIAAMSPSLGEGVPLGEHVRTIPAPDPLRMTGDLGAAFAAEVQAAIDDMLRHGIKPAGLIVDTIFSSDGVYEGPKGFLAPAVAAIRAAGGVFIADEVQPGFGRCGETMWGFQRHGVLPDMVSLGKPMGNGYPVAGLVMQPGVIAAFGAKARYFNTFGGNAVAAATAMAVLEVIESEGLQENARVVGDYFAQGLRDLGKRHDCLGPLRAAGLFLGQDIIAGDALTPDAARTSRIVNGLREARVLISATGPRSNVLKIRPPLVFSKANVDHFLQAFDQVLARV